MFLVVVGATVLGAPPLEAQEPAPTSPLGLGCVTQPDRVRFCAGNGTTDRVPSWDGTPLDVDVTLPPTGPGPFPTIVMLHGWGNTKTAFESTDPRGNGYNAGAGTYLPVTYNYNNDFYARRGYAVLTYTARGKGKSCGGGGAPQAQLQTGACSDGYIRLADQRYEIRDTQYLLGLLVDQGFAKPGALGVTGISYGGGQSLQLAYLKDRIRCSGRVLPGDPCNGKRSGDFLRWTSPDGVPLSITAAHPRWFWSDLVSSLLPNGRYLDFDPRTGGLSRTPIGVEIATFLNGLLATGSAGGFYVPPQPPGSPESPWDLTTYGLVFNAGEPYGEQARTIVDEITSYHQAFGIPLTSPPAALLLENGWNDELFPVAEALRVYNDLRTRQPDADVELLLGDVGHSKGSNKERANLAFNEQTASFFDQRLKGQGRTASAGTVTAFTTTCPATVPDGGPHVATSWDALHPGAVSLGTAAAQTITAPGGEPTAGAQLDPIATSNGCKTVPAVTSPGTAVYTLASSGFTLLGLPTLTTTITATGIGGQLSARLWDVAPDGQQRLVTRGVYRLLDNQTGVITFQLHGNGYRFATGNTVKLELLGADSPYYRPSNSPFSVTVVDTRISLPVLEAPGATWQIQANPYLLDANDRGRTQGDAAAPATREATAGPSEERELPATGLPAALAGLAFTSLVVTAGLRRVRRRSCPVTPDAS